MNNVVAKQTSIELYRTVAVQQGITAVGVLAVGGGIALALNKAGMPTAGGIVGGITGILGASAAINACNAALVSDAEIDATAKMIADFM